MYPTISEYRPSSIRRQSSKQQRLFFLLYAGAVFALLFILQLGRIFGHFYGAAMAIFLVLLLLAALRPAFSLGALIFLTIIGDQVAMPWWPMTHNLSSQLSVLYTSDGLTIKPVEILLLLVTGIWFVGNKLSPNAPDLKAGALALPVVIFTMTVIWGLFWGIARGGDSTVALFDAAPLLYMCLVYFGAVNLFTSFDHYRKLLIAIVVAITIESVHGLLVLPALRETIPDGGSPVAHTAALHMNILFLATIAAFWFGTNWIGKRWSLLLLSVPTAVLYIEAERRAAIVALAVGVLMFTAILYNKNRPKFFVLVPILVVVVLGYLGAFWNSTGPAGFPAQAIKTVIQPESASQVDASSDLYRDIENFDLVETVRSSPILGIGYGQPFLRPIPLPDISVFEYAPYIPHNTVLAVWTKTGIVGLLSFLYMLGFGLASGVRSALQTRDIDDAAMIGVLVAYIPMTLVLAFVEITFDATTTILLGIALAFVATVDGFPVREGPVRPTSRPEATSKDDVDGLEAPEAELLPSA